jgi:hypothetical protein
MPTRDIPTLLGVPLGAVEKGIFVRAAGHHEEVFGAYHESAPPNAWLAMLWNRVARTEIELNTIVGSGLGDAGDPAG